MTVCIIDTSIFCELLKVPNLCDEHERIVSSLDEKLTNNEVLLLPTTMIWETGNHIAQNGDGRQRRQAASRFVAQVGKALSGNSPFNPTPLHDHFEMQRWLDDFPRFAEAEQSFGDLSIVKTWEAQCELFSERRVYVWSKDKHLASYDRIGK